MDPAAGNRVEPRSAFGLASRVEGCVAFLLTGRQGLSSTRQAKHLNRRGDPMATPLLQRRYSAEEYLAYEREAETKHEFIAGQIIAMSGGSRAHARISMNLAQVLGPLLRDRPCETYGSDMRVKVTARGMYTYPDLTVVCGEEQKMPR